METSKTWIRTKTGKSFFPLKPKLEDLDVEDIAHALSHQCRFSGHTRQFYSVAQHSVHVSMLMMKDGHDQKFQLHGLLHDATEAYLVDVPTPIKSVLPIYKGAEKKLWVAIKKRFELIDCEDVVKLYDLEMFAHEARDLMGDPTDWKTLRGIKTRENFKIDCWPSALAKELFLKRFVELTEGTDNAIV